MFCYRFFFELLETNMIFLIEVHKLLNSSPIFFFSVNEYLMSKYLVIMFFLSVYLEQNIFHSVNEQHPSGCYKSVFGFRGILVISLIY